MNNSAFDKLVWLMDRLRDPGGCPWDREQTPDSLKPFVLEEAYEVVDAIDHSDPSALKEELGDLLYQVLFLARIAKENNQFDITEVLRDSYTKLYNRHPHVFGETKLNSSDEVLKNWEKIKETEKGNKRQSIMEGLPSSLPALLKAQRIQERASRVGFDWNESGPAFDKIKEELKEFDHAMKTGIKNDIENELGDLLFAIVNLSRFLKLSPEIALQHTIEKFSDRFSKMESYAREKGIRLEDLNLAELDELWNRAKSTENNISDKINPITIKTGESS